MSAPLHADTNTDFFTLLSKALRAEQEVALAEIIDGPEGLVGAKLLLRPNSNAPVMGTLGNADLDRVVGRDALGELAGGRTVNRSYGSRGEAGGRDVAVFIQCFVPSPQMIIFGAADFTAAVAQVAKVLGYRVTVCDARPVFATTARFPMADEVVVTWPDRHLRSIGASLGPRDVVCILSHDPKFDVPAIAGALATKVGYVGAMGSRRTHGDRVARLKAAGVSDEALGRLMSPIGLDIGARTPEEIAISIFAEIIARRTGRAASSLRDSTGPIHGVGVLG